MFDDHHADVIQYFVPEPAASLICPDYMMDRLRQASAGSVIVPYCAASSLGPEDAEAIIVHKGMLRALGWRRIAAMLATTVPVLANEVFVVFRRGAGRAVADPALDAHLAPLLAFCRHWQALPRRPSTGGLAVVASAWNVGNCGDDAVSLAAAAICRRLGFEEVALLGPDGPLDPIERAGLVVLGGGGLLYDDDIVNAANYTAPLRFAATCGVPFAALGVGTQGIRTPFGRAAFHDALSGAALIAARDPTDLAVLRDRCGLGQVEAGADLAFALPDLEPHWFTEAPRPPRTRPLALLSLGYSRETPALQGEPLLRNVLAMAHSLGETHDLLLAQHSTDDAVVYAEAARILGIRHVNLAELGVPMAIATYASADLVVTSRYHGAIFAALTGTPVATVCDGQTKLGRLVKQVLPSLASAATSLDEAGRPLLAGRDLARQARPAAEAEVMALRRRVLDGEARLAAALQRPAHAATGTGHVRRADPPMPKPVPAAPVLPPELPPWSPALVETCVQAVEPAGMVLTIGDPLPPALPGPILRRIAPRGAASADRTTLAIDPSGDATVCLPLDPASPWLDSIADALAAAGRAPVTMLRLAGPQMSLAQDAMRIFDPALMVLERAPVPPSADAFDALLVAIGITGRRLLTLSEGTFVPVPLYEAEPALRRRSVLCTEAAWESIQAHRAAVAP